MVAGGGVGVAVGGTVVGVGVSAGMANVGVAVGATVVGVAPSSLVQAMLNSNRSAARATYRFLTTEENMASYDPESCWNTCCHVSPAATP